MGRRRGPSNRHAMPTGVVAQQQTANASGANAIQLHHGTARVRVRPLTTSGGRQPPIAKANQRKVIARAPLVTPSSLQSAVPGSAAGLAWTHGPRSDAAATTTTTTGQRSVALEMSIQQVLQSRPQSVRELEEQQWRVEQNKEKAREFKRQLKAGDLDVGPREGGLSDGVQDMRPTSSSSSVGLDLAPAPKLGASLAPVDQMHRFPAPKPFVFPTPAPPPPPQLPFNAPVVTPVMQVESAERAGPKIRQESQPQEAMDVEEVDDEDDDDEDGMDEELLVVRAPSAHINTASALSLPSLSSTPAPAPLPSTTTSTSSITSKPRPTPVSRYRSAAPLTRGRTRKRKTNPAAPRSRRMELFDYLSSDSEVEGGVTAAGDDWTAPAPQPGSFAEREERRKRLPRGGRALGGKDTSHLGTASGSTHSKRIDLPAGERELLPASRAHAEKLVPTSYQAALLEKAKDSNIITCLPTGSGKTLVGVLLIEHVHSVLEPARIAALAEASNITEQADLEQLKVKEKKLQFFLTNSVPLVHQQANILAHNTTLSVGKLFGALGVNLSNEEEWKYNFETYDCLVLTAQLLLDTLAHGFIHMSQISLMVFDEAHHAKSNHPFASILRDFYHRSSPTARPKILGLTASPINSSEGLAEAYSLQKLFDAKLVTAPKETWDDLREMVAEPTVLQVEYVRAPAYHPTTLTRTVLSKVLVKDDQFRKYERAAEAALRDYGPDAQDLIWHLALQRTIQKYYPHLLDYPEEEEEQQQEQPLPKPNDPEFALIHPDVEMEKTSEGEKKEKVSGGEQEETEEDKDEPMEIELPEWLREIQAHHPTLVFDNLSPKLQTLVKLLGACKPGAETFCGIVFVNRRMDALLIAQIIKELTRIIPDLDWIKVDCVTGHGSSGDGGGAFGPRMAWSEQASVLTAFGEGETNLLIATSVVEEGLDVQPCRMVIRFDLYDTHISFVQSRGRARAPGSHYLLFVEQGNIAEQRKLIKIGNFDRGMADLLSQVETSYNEADYGDPDDDLDELDCLLEGSTNALLTPHFAISLLQRYCQSLPVSDAFSTNKPKFEFVELIDKSVTCTITLPTSARLRTVVSEPCLDMKTAKRSASFNACKILRNIGALDEHLLPMHTFVDEEPKDEQGRTIGSRKRQIGYEKKRADAWTPEGPFSERTTLYGTLLHYDGPSGAMTFDGDLYRPLVLLTRARLPDTPKIKLHIGGEPVSASASPLPGTFIVSKEQRVTLKGYSMRIWLSVLNRMITVDGDEMNYFLAPLKLDCSLTDAITIDKLDWAAMEHGAAVREEQLDWKDLSKLGDSLIVDLGKNECRYYYERTHPELHPTSTLPPGRQSDAGHSNVLSYYMSFNEQLFHRYHIHEEQPLLEVSRIPKVVTFLTATPSNNVTPSPKRLLQKTPRFAIPQLCSVHSLPSSIFRTCLMLPSILTELDQLLIVKELNDKVFHSRLDPDLVRRSLMCPSACLMEDYERLELLGDAFLKYVASVYCFVSMSKTCHEGELHRKRLHHISNSSLFIGGLRLGLPTYLFTRPFTSRQFLPPSFKLLRGQPPPDFTTIGDKTIADVVEALLGAAYETGHDEGGIREGFELALFAAIALNIEIKGVKEWDDFARIYGEIPQRAPVAELPVVVEQKLAYQFQHGHLLTEALTHPSKLGATATFQRLEWLGDSVLDFLVVRYCWTRWGLLPPGILTELKGAMVSNETLAAVAVELELDKWLAFDNAALAENLIVYREKIVEARELEITQAAQEQRQLRPYWLLLDPPKAVADIVESLFGAVLVDSGFAPEAPQRTFDHLLVPFFAKWVTPTSLKIDAIRILLETAQGIGCDDVSHISSTVEPRLSADGAAILQPRLTRTSVLCHNVVLATVETANPKTAKRLVSAEAVAWLECNPNFFANKCDCSHRRAVRAEEAAEEQERMRNEGLVSEPESDWDDDDGVEGGEEAEKKGEEAMDN